MQSGPSFLVTQLLGQAPMLILYLTAMVLALVFRARSSLASALVLAGAGLNLVVSVGWSFVIQATYSNMQGVERWLIVGQLLRTAGFALIIAAAFVDRRPKMASAFEVRTASLAPPAPPPPVRAYSD